MLRRKNNEIPYVQQRADQSPYHFQRKNINLSPGLSPMRCRTPTRTSNLSPFRGGVINDNSRGHSPIKFINNRANNVQTNGFYRPQNNGIHCNYNQKYSTCVNNDHSIRRQSYYQNENNSRIRNNYENTQRTGVHENTKLFSKLVQKLNSEKKKQPEMIKKNTKPEAFKVYEAQLQQKARQPKLVKQKSQPQSIPIEPITENIKAVQSVVYQQKQNSFCLETGSNNANNTYLHKQNNHPIYNQHQIYQIKAYPNQTNIRDQFTVNNPPQNFCSKPDETNFTEQKTATLKNLKNQNRSKDKQKIQVLKHKFQQGNQQNQYQGNTKVQYQWNQKGLNERSRNKSGDKHKREVYNQQESYFDDVKMYLDKLKQSKAFVINKDDSINNHSNSFNNMNMSMMNMDPFI